MVSDPAFIWGSNKSSKTKSIDHQNRLSFSLSLMFVPLLPMRTWEDVKINPSLVQFKLYHESLTPYCTKVIMCLLESDMSLRQGTASSLCSLPLSAGPEA